MIVTVAVAVAPCPSVIVYIKISVPVNPLSAVYAKVPSACNHATPSKGSVNDATSSVPPSGSLSLTSTLATTALFASVIARSSTARGIPFTKQKICREDGLNHDAAQTTGYQDELCEL